MATVSSASCSSRISFDAQACPNEQALDELFIASADEPEHPVSATEVLKRLLEITAVLGTGKSQTCIGPTESAGSCRVHCSATASRSKLFLSPGTFSIFVPIAIQWVQPCSVGSPRLRDLTGQDVSVAVLSDRFFSHVKLPCRSC